MLENEKFSQIPQLVMLRLLEPGKSIDQIEYERQKKISGNENEMKYRSKLVWHNKQDLDNFVQKKLGLTDQEVSQQYPSGGASIFYKAIADEISKLRENQTITDWNSDVRTGIWRMTYSDQIPNDESNISPLTGNYFIITQNPESKYDDIPGKQYAYDNHKPHYTKFIEGTNFIVQTKTDNQYYFVGWGKVGSIEKSQGINEKDKPITKIIATFSKYTKFEEPKIRTDKINEKMLKLAFPNTGFNSQPPAMLPITPSLYREIIGEDLAEQKQPTDTLDDLELNPFIEALKWKPNLILYGPPGTGKTHYANEIAKSITRNQNSNKIISDFKQQTWLGIAAKILLANNSTAINYNDFGKLASQFRDTDAQTPEETIARDIRDHIKKFGEQSIFSNPKEGMYGLHIPTTFVKAAEIILLARHEPMQSNEIAKVIVEKNLVETEGETPERTLSTEFFRDRQAGENSTFIQIKPGTYALRNQITNITKKSSFIKRVTFHQTFSYEEFIEGIKANPTKDGRSVTYDVEPGIFKEFCNIAREDDSQNRYVMIIDEINRGNIAKIFGELITIIEKDKREKPVTLAYSKEEFSVPKNVLIIGTMNTADQSLTHLDAALKRRFTMMEHYPHPNVLKNYKVNDEIDLTALLIAINNKLLKNNFRDGQIGHAYFMDGEEPLTKISDLQMVFAYDIIPLLRDYFYDDESKLKKIFDDYWFDENKDINKNWQGSSNANIEKFLENLHKSFGV